MQNLPPLLILIGPTASGKSRLAIDLAKRLRAEVLSCDSVQVYRHFQIGTGKLPLAERQGVTHHLIDCVDPGTPYSAGDYMRDGRRALAEITSRGNTPIVAGGTGLYLRALLEGLSSVPARNGSIRDRLERIRAARPATLHRLLSLRDPATAQLIASTDHQKLVRALDMIYQAGAPLGAIHAAPRQPLSGYRVLTIGLAPPRDQLRERIDQRVAAMFDAGLVQETKDLLEAGIPRAARAFSSLGYAQCLKYLDSQIGLAEACQETQARTRQYAKRQLTWFRHRADATWIPHFGDDSDALSQTLQIVHTKYNI